MDYLNHINQALIKRVRHNWLNSFANYGGKYLL